MDDGKRHCTGCGIKRDESDFNSNNKTCRRCCARSTIRRRADPGYQVRENARQRARDRAAGRTQASKGDIIQTPCVRCHVAFEYSFAGARRRVCDLCNQYKHEWHVFRLTGQQAAELRAIKTCGICGATEPGGRFAFRIDHCHKTGDVRGVLCHSCNIALGLMADDPHRLRAAADYIEKYIAREA